MSEKIPKNDNDSSIDEIIKVETLEMEKDEDMPAITSTPTESQEVDHKIVEIMTPHFDKLEKSQENYGFVKKELLEMKCLFDQLNLIDRIKTKFAFPKFTTLNYPIIKDPEFIRILKEVFQERLFIFTVSSTAVKNVSA